MIIPYILGRMIAPKNTTAPLLVVVWGYALLWAVFEVLALPCIFMRRSLNELLGLYATAAVIITVLSLTFFREAMKRDFEEFLLFFTNDGFRKNLFFLILDIGMVIAQAAFVFLYVHEDADDAEYVVMANDAWERNNLLVTDPYTGFKWTNASTKRYLSPFSLWISIISRVTGVAPARVAHAWIPVLIIILGYAAVFAALSSIFKDSPLQQAPYIGLFFFSLLVILGGGTTRSYGSMLLLRAWQGKAVLCAVILPLMLSFLVDIGQELLPNLDEMRINEDVESWFIYIIRLVILFLAGLLLTGMSIPMIPLLAGSFGVVYGCEFLLRKLHGGAKARGR